ncbi:retrograde regulation protein 2 [Tieghemiomyces parasiticus]|uniref:Retrograde regulation protein 2 n=1 Tax=Tieghemiomyces parasiticus TaxID=78921 RepID=A0A9W8DTH2_9FUNG|nr:retrograde regulation protein 2 [Tieghemiomyces parasiticus]
MLPLPFARYTVTTSPVFLPLCLIDGLALALFVLTTFLPLQPGAPTNSSAYLYADMPVVTHSVPQSPLAIVDMGSNGIRLGIYGPTVPMHPKQGLYLPSLRAFPVLFRQRAPISLSSEMVTVTSPVDTALTDHTRTGDSPVARIIPPEALERIGDAFGYFRSVCQQYRATTVIVVATEATRVAANRAELLARIRQATADDEVSAAEQSDQSEADTSLARLALQPIDDPAGWRVQVLSPSEESMMTSLGMQATFASLHGHTMDLGGGSMEIGTVAYDAPYALESAGIRREVPAAPKVSTTTGGESDGGNASFASFPFGANVLTQQLDRLADDEAQRDQLANRILAAVRTRGPQTASALDAEHRGLYLSGGGFRALASIAIHVRRHPVPIIHGYTLSIEQFLDLVKLLRTDASYGLKQLKRIPGISKRRAKMVPAVTFLVHSLEPWLRAHVDRVYFSEAGVQQGVLATVLAGSPGKPGAHSDNDHPTALWSWSQDPLTETVRTVLATTYNPAWVPPARWIAAVQTTWLATLDRYTSLFTAAGSPLSPGGRLLNAVLAVSNLCTTGNTDVDAVVGLSLFTRSVGDTLPVPSHSPDLAAAGVALTHPERALLSLVLYHRYGGTGASPENLSNLETLANSMAQDLVPAPAVNAAARVLGRLLHLAYTVAPLDWSVVADGRVTLEATRGKKGAIKVSLTSPTVPHVIRNDLAQRSLKDLNDELKNLSSLA